MHVLIQFNVAAVSNVPTPSIKIPFDSIQSQ
jgi:hypothetical protein